MARKPAGTKVGFDLNDAPGHLIRRAQQHASSLYTARVGTNGLTPQQFAVLAAVEGDEGLTQTDLVRRTGIDRSTLATMIARMVSHGLLARRQAESDARANAVSLTAKGRKALDSARPKAMAADDQFMELLPKTLQSNFLKALKVMADAAEAAEEVPARASTGKKAAKKKTAVKKTRAKKKASAKTKRTGPKLRG